MVTNRDLLSILSHLCTAFFYLLLDICFVPEILFPKNGGIYHQEQFQGNEKNTPIEQIM